MTILERLKRVITDKISTAYNVNSYGAWEIIDIYGMLENKGCSDNTYKSIAKIFNLIPFYKKYDSDIWNEPVNNQEYKIDTPVEQFKRWFNKAYEIYNQESYCCYGNAQEMIYNSEYVKDSDFTFLNKFGKYIDFEGISRELMDNEQDLVYYNGDFYRFSE